MVNPRADERAALQLLYDLHRRARSGRLRLAAADELVANAVTLDTAFRSAAGTAYRAALARVLLIVYVHLDRRLRAAPADDDDLPQVPGLGWCVNSPLAGLLEDIPPFAAADEWATAAGTGLRVDWSTRRKARRRQATRSRSPGLLGDGVRIEAAQLLMFPLGAERMPRLQDSDERNSALMRALADQAQSERDRPLGAALPAADESPYAAEMIRVANEAIAIAMFDSPVAHRLIHHYSLGTGRALTLTRAEMRQLRALFNLASPRLSEQFQTILTQVRDEGLAALAVNALDRTQIVRNVQFEVTGATGVNGTLAAFTGRCLGTLTMTVYFAADPVWSFDGRMDWYDEWDFESHANLGDDDLRSEAGNTRTWIGHNFVIGRPFRVGSEQIGIRQSSSEVRATLSYE